jgi:putative ABC transport system substrate-binding protein
MPLGIELIEVTVANVRDIEQQIEMFAATPNGGLLLLPDITNGSNRQLIFRLATQFKLPAIYSSRTYPSEGGLMAYSNASSIRDAAVYVDRLLRGAEISDLPIQFPSKFELVVNLKAAKAIGLTIPESFLLRADEIIE